MLHTCFVPFAQLLRKKVPFSAKAVEEVCVWYVSGGALARLCPLLSAKVTAFF